MRRDATHSASKAPPPPSRFVRAAALGRTVPPQPKKRAAEAPAAAAADLAGGLWPIVLNPLSSVRQLGRDLEKSRGERSLATNGLPSSGDMSPGARGLAWLEGLDYWLHAEGPERDRRQDAAAALEDLRRRAALRGNALKGLRRSLTNPAAGEGAWKGLMPRYFVWKDIASRIRSSSKCLPRSPATLAQGLSTVATRMARLVRISIGLDHGVCKHCLEKFNFLRFCLT